MKAVVDKNLCIGCGLCANICPECISMDDDGLAVAIDQEIDDSLIDLAKKLKSPVQLMLLLWNNMIKGYTDIPVAFCYILRFFIQN